MADIDLKTATPDTSLPTTGFLFGADSQASASPSVYSTQAVATTLLGSTTLSGTTITANAPVVDFAQTWNNAAVTFTAIKLNITDTASNAASLLMDLGTGGGSFVSKFSVSKAGGVIGSSFRQTSSGAGIQVNANGSRLTLLSNNAELAYGDGNNLTLASTTLLNWSSVAASSGSFDTTLRRRGIANLALGEADTGTTSATVTITIAVPGVVTWASHGLSTGSPVSFTTTGALPTGIVSGTIYYAVVITTSTIQLASSFANAVAATPTVITTTGTQSGVHTGARNAITQRLSVQGVTGVADRPGADFIYSGSQGTGTGAGGGFVFQVAPAGGAGSAQNALATALTINSAQQVSIQSAGTAAAPTLVWSADTTTGFYKSTGNILDFSVGGVQAMRFSSNGFFFTTSAGKMVVSSAGTFAFSSGTAGAAGEDVLLNRDDANKLALRNGTAAQAFNVYNTYTSASVFERGFMRFVSNELQIGGEQTGGTDRSLAIVANAAANYMRSGGNWIFQSTNGGTGYFALSNGDAANRMIIRNAALSDAPLIQIGGTTSSFPALKRSTTFLQARLADDSAFAGFASANVQAATAYTVATLPTPATGMIARVTDATAPTIGTTVAGGGAAYALVNYNGANWKVIGV